MRKTMAMRDALLRELIPHMEADSSIFFLTADFGSPVLDEIRERFPNNFINVGIHVAPARGGGRAVSSYLKGISDIAAVERHTTRRSI